MNKIDVMYDENLNQKFTAPPGYWMLEVNLREKTYSVYKIVEAKTFDLVGDVSFNLFQDKRNLVRTCGGKLCGFKKV